MCSETAQLSLLPREGRIHVGRIVRKMTTPFRSAIEIHSQREVLRVSTSSLPDGDKSPADI